MKYVVCCVLKGDVSNYQHKLVDDVYESFGISFTKKQKLVTHFTLKSQFEMRERNIGRIEKIIRDFCSDHKKSRINIGGFGNFSHSVVFIKVRPSKAAKSVFFDFISELNKVREMQWDSDDGKKRVFHLTIAEECDKHFNDVWKFLQSKEARYFDCWFDNITIFKPFEIHGRRLWRPYKSFLMQ
jgi:2'-5' RNA ligase